MAVDGFARAKINLALHVTGRRADGYHLLDSLVAFADVGDRISVEPAADLSLHLTGPYACTLSATDNLCLTAARLLHPTGGARITLDKHLPIAAGIGGGSADAAATLRALAQLWALPLPPPDQVLALGADVPVCLAGHAARMQGIGDHLTPISLPAADIVLIHCGAAVATKAVFAALDSRSDLVGRATSPLAALPKLPDVRALAAFLQGLRNDLASPAMLICPEIARVLSALEQRQGCLIARMSGSGATCFGLFPDASSARTAAHSLQRHYPQWWVQPACLQP